MSENITTIGHYYFPDPKTTYSYCLFCLTTTQNPNFISFQLKFNLQWYETEKQLVLVFKKLETANIFWHFCMINDWNDQFQNCCQLIFSWSTSLSLNNVISVFMWMYVCVFSLTPPPPQPPLLSSSPPRPSLLFRWQFTATQKMSSSGCPRHCTLSHSC